MSDEAGSRAPARERWNERYASDDFEPFPDAPAQWLVEHDALLLAVAGAAAERGAPAGGTAAAFVPRALDVACGDGRNAHHLAQLGFAVDALDVSDVAVARLREAASRRGLRVNAQVADLERDGLPASAYDVVVCMHYLQRDLFGALQAALAPGGLLLYETFSRAHVEELGRSFNPAYVLDRNELLRAFAGLHVHHYREGLVERRGEPRGVASIVAQRLARSD
jgi:SAM-dependent methyltransferase